MLCWQYTSPWIKPRKLIMDLWMVLSVIRWICSVFTFFNALPLVFYIDRCDFDLDTSKLQCCASVPDMDILRENPIFSLFNNLNFFWHMPCLIVTLIQYICDLSFWKSEKLPKYHLSSVATLVLILIKSPYKDQNRMSHCATSPCTITITKKRGEKQLCSESSQCSGAWGSQYYRFIIGWSYCNPGRAHCWQRRNELDREDYRASSQVDRLNDLFSYFTDAEIGSCQW